MGRGVGKGKKEGVMKRPYTRTPATTRRTSLLFIRSTENHRGGTDGDDRPILNADAVFGFQYFVLQESSGTGWSVAKHEMRVPVPVHGDVNTAMRGVDAWVDSPYCCIGVGSAHETANAVFSFMEHYLLTEMKGVFNDGQIAVSLFRFRFVFFSVSGTGIRNGGLRVAVLQPSGGLCFFCHPESEPFPAFRAFEHKDVPAGIVAVVKDNGIVTFRASYPFHLMLFAVFVMMEVRRSLCVYRTGCPRRHCGSSITHASAKMRSFVRIVLSAFQASFLVVKAP